MRFSFRGTVTGFGIAALIFFCSCDKHYLGELPEVQKEHVDLAHESKAGPKKAESPAPEATPTPAEFFPQSSPH